MQRGDFPLGDARQLGRTPFSTLTQIWSALYERVELCVYSSETATLDSHGYHSHGLQVASEGGARSIVLYDCACQKNTRGIWRNYPEQV